MKGEFVDEILAPHNLVFYVSILLGLVMLIGSALGIGGHDVGHQVSHDVGHAAHGVGHGHQGHTETKHVPLISQLLGFIGVGKVPITFLAMMIALIFGVTGLIMNRVMEGHPPQTHGWIPLGVAMVTALFVTGILAKFASSLVPSVETYNVTTEDIVGTVGVLTVSTDTKFGILQVRDAEGNLRQVSCKTSRGELPKGSEVLILDYDADKNLFLVEKSTVDAPREPL